MQPHAGVTQTIGIYIAGVFTNRHTFRILFFTFHPQIGVCLHGVLMIIFGLCLVNPLPPSEQDKLEWPTCRTLRRPLACPLVRPLKRPLASKPAFFKLFGLVKNWPFPLRDSTVAGSFAGNHVLHCFVAVTWVCDMCTYLFGVLHRLLGPCGRGGFLVILLFRCRADIFCENGGRK